MVFGIVYDRYQRNVRRELVKRRARERLLMLCAFSVLARCG